MEPANCAMHCYGLMSAVDWQGTAALHPVNATAIAYNAPHTHIDSHILAILTPPPRSFNA